MSAQDRKVFRTSASYTKKVNVKPKHYRGGLRF